MGKVQAGHGVAAIRLTSNGCDIEITSLVTDHLLLAPRCSAEPFLQLPEALSHGFDCLEEATVGALAGRIGLLLVLH